MDTHRKTHPRAFRRGLSLVELLLSLAITAMLLTATMVALDVSFHAYADAAEQASTQAATRMITNRLLTLLRTSTAHGPLQPDPLAVPPVVLNGNTLTSNFIQLVDSRNNIVTVTYQAGTQQLFLSIQPVGGGAIQTQPMLSGVTNAQFFLVRRWSDDDGAWVLERGTMDLTVTPGGDATLSLENGQAPDVRMIASTKPRKIG